MKDRSITARNVTGREFVRMGRIDDFVRNVTVVAFIPMGNGNLIVRIVVGEPIVNMANLNVFAYIVMVEGCARPHIVLPPKIALSTKDTVFFALYIRFLLSAWQGIIGRRGPLW